jgi:NAD(P)-dependent dehydrogenase (short-subunit alcohol dehydrogenase family)
MDELRGRVAVITGGASGIGLATAKRLAREGMKIVLADLDRDALGAARPEVEKLGTEVLAVPTDVGELAQVRALAERTVEHFGAAHVVFNNAGVGVAGLVHQYSHEEWEWVLRVNLWGVIHGVEVFVPRLLEQGEGGHVVNTASFAGLVPNFAFVAYCVSKYGVVALSECLSRELRDSGIGVSVLCPMRVETNIGENSARDRPGGGGPLSPEAEGPAGAPPLAGQTLGADEVAERVLRAIRGRELYILTHPESREFIRRRFERIERAFDA